MIERLREQLVAALARVPKRREELSPALEEGASLLELERAVQMLLAVSGAPLLEEELQARADAVVSPDDRRPRRCPVCGAEGKYWRREKRAPQSTIGPLRYARAVFRCEVCGLFAPADEALGLAKGAKLTPFMEWMSEQFGRECGSFEAGRRLMASAVQAPGSASTIEAVIVSTAAALHERQQELIKLLRREPSRVPMIANPACAFDTVVIEIDGGMMPCREDDRGLEHMRNRRAKPLPLQKRKRHGTRAHRKRADVRKRVARKSRQRADANASTAPTADNNAPPTLSTPRSLQRRARPRTRHREFKTAAVYLLRDRIVRERARSSRPPRATITRSLNVARLGHWHGFADHAQLIAHQIGAARAQRIVLLGDGASWIDAVKDNVFPDAIRILDFFHAIEHIAEPARAALLDAADREQWLDTQRARLRNGELDAVLNALLQLRTRHTAHTPITLAELQRVIARTVNYLRKRREQMDYPYFEAQGLPIASGLIEGRIRNLKSRLDGAGYRWSQTGGQALLTLTTNHQSTPLAA